MKNTFVYVYAGLRVSLLVKSLELEKFTIVGIDLKYVEFCDYEIEFLGGFQPRF